MSSTTTVGGRGESKSLVLTAMIFAVAMTFMRSRGRALALFFGIAGALIVAGVGLSVFGFQQSALWGWATPAWISVAVGVVLLVMFFIVERRTESPLINVRILWAGKVTDLQCPP